MKDTLLARIAELEKGVADALKQAVTEASVMAVKVHYLGKKGELTAILKEMKGLSSDERPLVGEAANRLKTVLEAEVDKRLEELKSSAVARSLSTSSTDISLPGRSVRSGHFHPISLIMDEMKRIFVGMGFSVFEGPEVESDFFNFEALNFPKDHPARDMQDTFYVGENLLRTHTSPVQVHVMQSHRPPLRMIAPGAVYRRDADMTHSPMFHQVEGLVVDQAISMADLKGTLTVFLKDLFGDLKVRFRPSYFPFTEPSAEVDIECVFCHGSGCRVCKESGWLEIMGAGMVDPNVFSAVGYDPKSVTGFAFGVGIERVAMLKFGIPDIRMLFEGDLRFLKQF